MPKSEMKRSPTVVDVAKLAGVGPSTVSRFLRGVNISKNTAARVEAAIRETGYQPDETARALRIGKSSSLGVIVPKVSNAFFSQAVQVLEERAREAGYTVMLMTHQDRQEEQARQLSTLRRARVDGVLMTPVPGSSGDEVRKLLGDVPLVCFDAVLSAEFDAVVLQNRQASAAATEHLLAHGYKRVAAVTAKPKIYSFAERLAGYREALEARGLEPRPIVGEDYEELRHLLRGMLAAKKRPEALLSLSDFATLNVIRIYEELGLEPEEWIPMIGFDDFSYAPLLGRPVTVVVQPVEELMRTALHLLLRRIDGALQGAEPQLVQIPGELTRRRSCGCR